MVIKFACARHHFLYLCQALELKLRRNFHWLDWLHRFWVELISFSLLIVILTVERGSVIAERLFLQVLLYLFNKRALYLFAWSFRYFYRHWLVAQTFQVSSKVVLHDRCAIEMLGTYLTTVRFWPLRQGVRVFAHYFGRSFSEARTSLFVLNGWAQCRHRLIGFDFNGTLHLYRFLSRIGLYCYRISFVSELSHTRVASWFTLEFSRT